MTTRRGFLEITAGALAGIAFVGCDLMAAAPARAQARRREVVVNGRRAKTVDVHAHCAVLEAMALMGLNPDRFVAFATVALQHPDLAAEQLEEGVRKYGLRGAAIGGSVNGEEISDPKFHPFWAKAEQLGVLVFIHPQGSGVATEIPNRLKGNGLLDNVIGNPLETTIALSHLIFEGTHDKFPGLKICAAHGGGYLPSYAARSDHGCLTQPARCPGGTHGPITKKPSEYLKQMYYDTMMFTPEGVRRLLGIKA